MSQQLEDIPQTQAVAPASPQGDAQAADGPTFGAIAVGGALGAGLRHGLNLALPTGAAGFPLATFCANVAGAFLLGLVATLIARSVAARPYLQPLICTGLLGSFTTFSTFSLETLSLLEAGRWVVALLYMVGSITAGLIAGLLGMTLAQRLDRSSREEPR